MRRKCIPFEYYIDGSRFERGGRDSGLYVLLVPVSLNVSSRLSRSFENPVFTIYDYLSSS